MSENQVTKKLERKINFLTAYALLSALIISFFAFSSFSEKDKNEKLDELTVKKITIIGEDNLPRMVLSNETRQHPGRMNGKEWEKRERPSGIIFFNNEGDECGGLVFQTKEKNGKIMSGMSFTMDNYKDDQVLQILNDEYYADGKAYIKTDNRFQLIRDWAGERGLYSKGDTKTQFCKLMEEAGELGRAILKDDNPEFKDAIGDMVVVLTNLAHLGGTTIEDCIDAAYDVISKRTGKMVNGTFVKDEK